MSMSPSYFVTDSRVGYPSFCFLHLLYIIMDKDKEDCVTHVENYLNKYGYEYTPTVTVDKPKHRARHSDLDAL